MGNEADYFAEGADARLAGQSETANPYDPEGMAEAHTSWNDGWNSVEMDEDAEANNPHVKTIEDREAEEAEDDQGDVP